MNKFYLIISALPQCGKDRIGNAISTREGIKRASCSDYIKLWLADGLARYMEGGRQHEIQIVDGKMLDPYKEPFDTGWLARKFLGFIEGLPKDDPDPSHSARPYLISAGNYGVYHSTHMWVESAANDGVRVLTGVRRRAELLAGRAWLEKSGFEVHVIWVERVGWKGVPADNTDVSRADATAAVIVPEGDIEHAVSGIVHGPALSALEEGLDWWV
jgi:hypothetical protein